MTKRSFMRGAALISGVLMIAVAAIGTVWPGAEAAPAAVTVAEAGPAPQAPAGLSGMVVVRDEESGALRAPNAIEYKALNAQDLLERTGEGLRGKMHADGTLALPLQAHHLSVAVAKVEAGEVVTDCVTDTHQADAFFTEEASDVR